MNTATQFDAWLTKAQNKSFEEKRDALDPIYTKYTTKGDSSEFDYRSVTGTTNLGPASVTTDVGDFPKAEYTPGTELVVKYKKVTIGMVVPEFLEEDMRNNGRVKYEKIGFFEKVNQGFIDSMNWTFEIISSDFLNRGDSAVATSTWQGAGRDGLALLSAAHVTSVGVPVTWSNLQAAGPLNALNLKEAITMLENIPDERGKPQSDIKHIIIECGRYYEWRLPEILKSALQPDTANNTINSVTARGIKYTVVINPYLGVGSKRWAVINGDQKSMLHFMKTKPSFSKATDPYTGAKIYRAVARFAIAHDSSKDIVGNLGA